MIELQRLSKYEELESESLPLFILENCRRHVHRCGSARWSGTSLNIDQLALLIVEVAQVFKRWDLIDRGNLSNFTGNNLN